MKRIIFIVITFFPTIIYLQSAMAQVTATGHISADVINMNNISFREDSLQKVNSSTSTLSSEMSLSDPNQTFTIGELKINDEENLSDNSVDPFFVKDPQGNKIKIYPSLKLQKTGKYNKVFQLKARLPVSPENKKSYKGSYSITVNYN